MISTLNVSLPVAAPVTGSITSILVSALVQVPPAGLLRYVVVLRLQNAALPVIVDGSGCTVACTLLIHPVTGSVYDILAVPSAAPDTTPVGATGATAVLLLLQVPPVLVVASVCV
jgi:hypothetical protein